MKDCERGYHSLSGVRRSACACDKHGTCLRMCALAFSFFFFFFCGLQIDNYQQQLEADSQGQKKKKLEKEREGKKTGRGMDESVEAGETLR